VLSRLHGADERLYRFKTRRRAQPGHVPDIAARIEHRQVLGGLISEYRRAA
jgi:hypothetical protein